MRLLLALLFLAAPAAAQVPSAAGQYKIQVIASCTETFGIDAPCAMLASQLHVESAWRSHAVSPVGARGLCQFMPQTAAGMARAYPDLRPPLPLDPSWCIRARDRLILENHRRYQAGRSECSKWLMAFVSYVGSPAALDREIALCRADEGCDPSRWYYNVSEKRSRTASAFREARNYPDRIIVLQHRYIDWGPLGCVVR